MVHFLENDVVKEEKAENHAEGRFPNPRTKLCE